MPQVDLVTFYPIVFGTAAVYFVGLFVVSVGPLLSFLSSLKAAAKRAISAGASSLLERRERDLITIFPLVAL